MALVTLVELQMTFRERPSVARRCCLVTPILRAADGRYLPTIVGAVRAAGADYNTTVAVGTGEMLIDRGVAHLFKLRGLLKDLPDSRF